MAVGIVDRIAIEDVATRNLQEVGGDIGRVGRNEEVGHDAATAIDHLPLGGYPLERVGKANRIGREKFVVLETIP